MARILRMKLPWRVSDRRDMLQLVFRRMVPRQRKRRPQRMREQVVPETSSLRVNQEEKT
jgi:hypothetical protein